MKPMQRKALQQLLKEDPIFQKMLNHLKEKFNCHTIVLYGSRACGTGITDSSDYDIIAIRKESFHWLKMHDIKVYHAFEKALSHDAEEIDIQYLIKLVIN